MSSGTREPASVLSRYCNYIYIYNSLAKTVLCELDHTSEDADRGSLLGAEKVTDALTTACASSVKLMYNSVAAIAL